MAVRISGKLPSSAGRGALPDGRRGGGTAPCEPTHLAGIPQQPRVAFYPFGREGALPGNGAARGAGSELPQAAGVRRLHEKVNGRHLLWCCPFTCLMGNLFLTVPDLSVLNEHHVCLPVIF